MSNIALKKEVYNPEVKQWKQLVSSFNQIKTTLSADDRETARRIIQGYYKNSADAADLNELRELVMTHHPLLDGYGITSALQGLYNNL